MTKTLKVNWSEDAGWPGWLFSLEPCLLSHSLVYNKFNIILFKSAAGIDLACFHQLLTFCYTFSVPSVCVEGFWKSLSLNLSIYVCPHRQTSFGSCISTNTKEVPFFCSSSPVASNFQSWLQLEAWKLEAKKKKERLAFIDVDRTTMQCLQIWLFEHFLHF